MSTIAYEFAKKIFIFAFTLIMIGCEFVPTPENNVKKSVREMMVDPSSAQFGEIYAGAKPGYYCGSVNGKNRMGGYAGEQQFSFKGSPESDFGVVTIHGEVATDEDFRRLYYMNFDSQLYTDLDKKCKHPAIYLEVCGKPFPVRSSGYCSLMNSNSLGDVLRRNF